MAGDLTHVKIKQFGRCGSIMVVYNARKANVFMAEEAVVDIEEDMAGGDSGGCLTCSGGC